MTAGERRRKKRARARRRHLRHVALHLLGKGATERRRMLVVCEPMLGLWYYVDEQSHASRRLYATAGEARRAALALGYRVIGRVTGPVNFRMWFGEPRAQRVDPSSDSAGIPRLK